MIFFSFQAERPFLEAQQDEVLIIFWLLKMSVPFKQKQFFFTCRKFKKNDKVELTSYNKLGSCFMLIPWLSVVE